MDLASFAAGIDDIAGFYGRKPDRKKLKTKIDLPRHDANERFILGPIPFSWIRSASKCGSRSEAVALLLWFAAGWQKTNPVKLTASILAELTVHPKTARRVLRRMEERGLVRCEFHRGRSPVVTIVKPAGERVE